MSSLHSILSGAPLFDQSLESLWAKERQLYTEQLQALEQSLIETKKVSIDQQTQIMQLTVQLESTDGPLRAQVSFVSLRTQEDCCGSERSIVVRSSSLVQQRSLEVGIDEKNEAILNLDRQLRERTQRIEQVSPLTDNARCYSVASPKVTSRPSTNGSSNGKSTDCSEQDHSIAQGNSQEASGDGSRPFPSR